ncbi:unnamed protein product [Schistosoma curassoni]|uniref:Uncharacterized protein n=1 Tax=Schistosoma curassoni TaxID=6186 RepID=A0A183KYL8_9TREM|nr:unnamed protein product [Schistosoma curassoni]
MNLFHLNESPTLLLHNPIVQNLQIHLQKRMIVQ